MVKEMFYCQTKQMFEKSEMFEKLLIMDWEFEHMLGSWDEQGYEQLKR